MAYRDVFPRKHTLLAVVHVESPDQAYHNTEVAFENGADGVFLINHHHSHGHLLAVYEAVRQRIGKENNHWIGVNMIGLNLESALGCMPRGCPGLWTDQGVIYETEDGEPSVSIAAEDFKNDRKILKFDGLWFGGYAFKHQVQIKDLFGGARLAKDHIDVITTSGDKTGLMPPLPKIATIRGAIGPDHPLAIASGMTPDNVELFKPYADCFIVATGMSSSFTSLDPTLVKAMAEAVHA